MLIQNILLLSGASLFSHSNLCNGFVSKPIVQSIRAARAGADIDRALTPQLSMASSASSSSDDISTDVLIIGAGLAGLSAAHWIINNSDLSVTVLERETLQLQSSGTTAASFSAAGVLGLPKLTEGLEEGSQLWNLLDSSRGMYQEWVKKVEEDASAADDLVEAMYSVTTGAGFLPNQVLVYRDGDTDRSTSSGGIDPRRLTANLRAACANGGVQLKFGEEWQVESLAKDGDTCTGVNLNNGDFIPSKTVIAANGAFVNKLLDVPVTPSKGQSVLVRMPEGCEPIKQAMYNADVYVVPKSDGRILIGATVEPGKVDGVIDEKLDDILSYAKNLVPGLKDCVVEESFVGLRPMTIDFCPIIGEMKELKNAHISGGFCCYGVLLAPKAAELIGTLVVNKFLPDDQQLSVLPEDQDHLETYRPNREYIKIPPPGVGCVIF